MRERFRNVEDINSLLTTARCELTDKCIELKWGSHREDEKLIFATTAMLCNSIDGMNEYDNSDALDHLLSHFFVQYA